jgi:dolichol-phosphate mannosyltransferase
MPPPDVSILVPALNEESTISQLLERLIALPVSKEIIVIDDGSDDGTGAILKQYQDRVTVLTNPSRTGKGSAIRQALQVATGRVTVIQDADLEYVPEELSTLVEPILQGRERVVYGTRFAHGFPSGMALPNKVVNWLLIVAVGILFGKKVGDEATCYKAFLTEDLKKMNLVCQRFEFCPEVTAKSIRMGLRIAEVPISYTPRTKEAGKKIRWTDAPEAFWTLLRHRFSRF